MFKMAKLFQKFRKGFVDTQRIQKPIEKQMQKLQKRTKAKREKDPLKEQIKHLRRVKRAQKLKYDILREKEKRMKALQQHRQSIQPQKFQYQSSRRINVAKEINKRRQAYLERLRQHSKDYNILGADSQLDRSIQLDFVDGGERNVLQADNLFRARPELNVLRPQPVNVLTPLGKSILEADRVV